MTGIPSIWNECQLHESPQAAGFSINRDRRSTITTGISAIILVLFLITIAVAVLFVRIIVRILGRLSQPKRSGPRVSGTSSRNMRPKAAIPELDQQSLNPKPWVLPPYSDSLYSGYY